MAASMRRSAAVALLCCMAAAAYTACALPTGPDTRPRISEQVINFPGPLRSARDGVPIVDPPTRIAGYFRLNRTQDAHMFYFLFNSRSAKDDPGAHATTCLTWLGTRGTLAHASSAGSDHMLLLADVQGCLFASRCCWPHVKS